MTKTALPMPEEPKDGKSTEKKKRRNHGDGGLYWSESRKRWIAEITIGFTPAGKRIVRKGSGRTKTEAKAKLKENIRDFDDGLSVGPSNYTVKEAVDYWLKYGLSGRSQKTIDDYEGYAKNHVIP